MRVTSKMMTEAAEYCESLERDGVSHENVRKMCVSKFPAIAQMFLAMSAPTEEELGQMDLQSLQSMTTTERLKSRGFIQ